MTNPRSTSKVDLHIAIRLRAARLESKLTQDEVARSLGVSFQQIQKYERGANRISAARLFEISQLYGKPLDWFFTGSPEANGKKKPVEDIGAKLIATPHGVDIAKHYLALPGLPARQLVIDIAKALSRQ